MAYTPDYSTGTSLVGRPSNTTVIAASNSSAAAKAGADYVCTGTADQVIINAAIAAVESNSLASRVGGKIRLRDGQYNTTGSIVVDGSYVDIEGESHPFWGGYIGHGWQNTSNPVGLEGSSGVKIKASASGFDLITIAESNITDGGENRHRAIRIASLYLYGNSYLNKGISGGGNDDRCIFEDMYIQNVSSGMDLWMDTALIRNNNIQDIAGDGITLKGTKGHICENLIWDIGGKCIVVQSPCDGTLIENNNLSAPASNVIYLNAVTGCTIVGNTIDNSTGALVLTNDGSGHVITGNKFITRNTNSTHGIQIGNTVATTGCAISGNTFNSVSAVAGYAIEIIPASTGCSSTGNSITGGGWNSSSINTTRYGVGTAFSGNSGTNEGIDPRYVLGSNLIGMYDASDRRTLTTNIAGTTAVTANNDPVGLWKDLSSNAYNLSAINASSPDWRPQYKTAGVNSLPSVHFSGSQFMQNADSGSWAGHPRTLWCMIGVTVASGTAEVIIAYPHNSTWSSPYADWMMYEVTGTSFTTRLGSTTNDTAVTTLVTPCILSWGNNTGVLFQNNVSLGSTGTTGAMAFPNNTGISIGAHNGSGTLAEGLVGDIVAIILSNAEPSAAQQLLMYKWMQTRMGITASG